HLRRGAFLPARAHRQAAHERLLLRALRPRAVGLPRPVERRDAVEPGAEDGGLEKLAANGHGCLRTLSTMRPCAVRSWASKSEAMNLSPKPRLAAWTKLWCAASAPKVGTGSSRARRVQEARRDLRS